MKTYRWEIAADLPDNSIGIELGVARGEFSEALLKTGKFKEFISIDKWDDHHDENEYLGAKERLSKFPQSVILRGTFSQFLDQFPLGYADFIYIDGYAHTGEDDGKTFEDWWPILAPGGLFAGDDYHPRWPLVMQNINKFAYDRNLEVEVFDFEKKGTPFSHYPSWTIRKPL